MDRSWEAGAVLQAEKVAHVGISEDEDEQEDKEDEEKDIATKHYIVTDNIMDITEAVLSVKVKL